MSWSDVVMAGLWALVASAVAAPLVMWLLRKLESRQTVSEYVPEHAAKQGTPTMGGLIVLVGVLVGTGLAWTSVSTGLLVLIVSFAVIGFLDDFVVPRAMPGKRGLSWKWKLLLEVVAATGSYVVFGGMVDAWAVLYVFVVLLFSNAFNFADGMDGLAGGLNLVLCLSVLAIAYVTRSSLLASVTPMLAGMAMGTLPFLFLNAPPAKVFMGDVASLPLGAALGFVFSTALFDGPLMGPFAQSTGSGYTGLAVWLMSPVLLLEILPVPLQIGWVKLTGKRMFAFKTPVHHGFQSAGWPETRVVWTFVLAQTLLCLAAIGLVVTMEAARGR